mgnify:CR=1 FL=1
MSYLPIVTRFSKTNISAPSTGATLIGTTENGTQKFYTLHILVSVRTANTILAVATCSIGTNGATYNNILPATALTGLTAANMYLRSEILTATGSVNANTEIYVNITVAATATAKQIDLHLLGYYE